MLTTKEAAQRLGFKNTGSVRQLILAERLKAEKRGRDWWINEEEIERFQVTRQPAGRPHKSRRGVKKPEITETLLTNEH